MVDKDAAWAAAELKALREAAGLSKTDVARALDMRAPMITKREEGEQPFKFAEIPFFAELYGLTDKAKIREFQEAVRRNKR